MKTVLHISSTTVLLYHPRFHPVEIRGSGWCPGAIFDQYFTGTSERVTWHNASKPEATGVTP